MPEQRRLVVAINPNASFGKARDAGPRAVELLRAAGHEVRPLVAPTGTLLAERAREEVEAGADALVVVGGDGMVHLAANILAETDTPLGLIPTGTGNDLAKGLGLPEHSVEAAVEALLAALEREPIVLDTGIVEWGEAGARDSRRFVGAVSCGFDAIVNERANAMRHPKGQSRYTLAILRELVALRPIPYRIEFDGQVLELDGALVSVANNRSLGGMLITPDASMTDGLLDLFVVRSLSRTAFLRIYPKVYRGEHVSDPRVQIIRASRIRVGLRSDARSSLRERSEPTGIVGYADGERLGPLPVDVRVVPASLRCYAPVRAS
ncbi:MAG TPA: diacylglycerol kinase family protein [Microbacteriaceae bacterium]|nr:diacylglycerol kinase family protein [Microbacteriaceae bacterium]